MAYFTLLERMDGQWFPAYGSYDKEDANSEFQEYVDNGTAKRKDLKIVKTETHYIEEIEREIAKLNT